jgi:hypothetical protein
MPYDPVKDPWRGVAGSMSGFGRAGALVVPDDANDLARYARIRVFAPVTLPAAQIRILPANALDAAPLTLPLPVGQVSVLEFLVRRVFATDTTAGVVIHRID